MVLLRLGEGELKNVAKGQEGREGDIVSLFTLNVFFIPDSSHHSLKLA